MNLQTLSLAVILLCLTACKEGSNFGITAGFGGAEVGYKYNAPRKSRVKAPKPTPTPTPTITPSPSN